MDGAHWDADRRLLVLAGSGPAWPWRVELPLTGGVALVLLARERVRWTTLLTCRPHLDGLGDVPITARRRPGTGMLRWVVRLPIGVGHDDPRLSPAVDAVIAELRVLAGI